MVGPDAGVAIGSFQYSSRAVSNVKGSASLRYGGRESAFASDEREYSRNAGRALLAVRRDLRADVPGGSPGSA
jgi:hypothetical protein